MLYLLNQDFPSFYKLQEQPTGFYAGGRPRFGPPDPEAVKRGAAAYAESCAMCHGADRAGTPAAPSLLAAGGQIVIAAVRRIVTYGSGRMPPLPHVTEAQIVDILAFMGGGAARAAGPSDVPADAAMPAGPVAESGGAPRGDPPEQPVAAPENYPAGVAAPATRYYTDYGLGHPYLMGPPWSQIVAYDLNRGVIKWTKPLGHDRDVAAAGGKDTGLPRGTQRRG